MTYPRPPGDKGVFQLGIINITTALVADMVLFNSKMCLQVQLAVESSLMQADFDEKLDHLRDESRELTAENDKLRDLLGKCKQRIIDLRTRVNELEQLAGVADFAFAFVAF